MTRIADLLAQGRTYSFEFFPPKTDEATRELEKALTELEPLGPSFVSVTYGAGGSTRARTHEVVAGLLHGSTMTPMAHLTCAGHRRADLESIVTAYRDEGVENILALGGDPPAGTELEPGELVHASELVDLIQGVGSFSVGVAAHPEVHPRSTRSGHRSRLHRGQAARGRLRHLPVLLRRATTGPRLVEELAARGVDKPVVPGIMPVTNLAQITGWRSSPGAELPAWLVERLVAAGDDPAAVREAGVAAAIDLCRDLLAAGAPGLHFYTLNRSRATREIYEALGLSA